jgi:hypothetical protein
MDEFQVLFSQEDRLAREAGQLLADIAKRGAAFGLHLLLATQSPGGPLTAYLRPVYEQMALRIALGCTQPSVSQAILGEGNDAATRLIRAGDAIYNDRRGEGANPVMRIAMLPTRERLALIGSIRGLAGGVVYPPPASFDPDAAADFGAHPACALFAGAVVSGSGPAVSGSGSAVEAWLGEAIAIKPATTATFERYVRSNLLVVPPCSARRCSAPPLPRGSASRSSADLRHRSTISSLRCSGSPTRCGSRTCTRRGPSWRRFLPSWTRGLPVLLPRGLRDRSGSSSSRGCTGGMSW